ncbi:MAG: Asp23/Gls24 family envelope stress response protein [Anaerolineales bacterium]|nr:Asp23/Gls24 family envelope stress response protein [Anaerolineales bacterium]
MDEGTPPSGKTTIAPDVLLNVATLTTLNTEGVSRMSAPPGGVNRLWKRGHQSEGVRIEILENTVNVDIFLILKPEVNVRQVSRNVQHAVSRAISEMVGMQPGKINIHVEDIDFEEI